MENKNIILIDRLMPLSTKQAPITKQVAYKYLFSTYNSPWEIISKKQSMPISLGESVKYNDNTYDPFQQRFKVYFFFINILYFADRNRLNWENSIRGNKNASYQHTYF